MLQPRKQAQIKHFLFEGAATGNTLIHPLPVLHKRAGYFIVKVLFSLKNLRINYDLRIAIYSYHYERMLSSEPIIQRFLP